MSGGKILSTLLQTLGFGAALAAAGALTAPAAHALNVGYYEMCLGEGKQNQMFPIQNAGHTAIPVTVPSTAEIGGLSALFVNNCDNVSYGQEYLDHLADIEAAVANGLVLIIHDRFVDLGETILPGGEFFDVVRDASAPNSRDIDVADSSTLLTNGPAGTITSTNLDGGCESDHGFTVAGSVPDDARVILTRPDASQLVTFAYGYGKGAVVYSTIPLDFYLDNGSCNIGPTVRDVYAVNAMHYAAALSETYCGNAGINAGEECDLGAGNNGETCCAFDCSLRGAGVACRAGDACDPAELCDGVTTTCPADVIDPAGTVCRAAADDCDIAELCDGVDLGCPADEVKPDTDVDTVCDFVDNCDDTPNPDQADGDADDLGDLCDLCTTLTPALQGKGTKIVVAKLNTAPGDDRVTLVGSFTGVPESPVLDPIANGVRIVLDGDSGGVIDTTIPAGAYDKNTKVGWRTNAGGTTFKYTNGSAALIDGINAISIRKTKTPGQIKFSIRGKLGSYPVGPSALPLGSTLVLDPPLAESGQCTETSFTPGRCKFNAAGSTVTCK